MRRHWPRPTAVVIRSDDIGSAIAFTLDQAGYATVLCDDVDPSWPRRGMAFTDAWYVGNAELSGTSAVFCATVKSIPALLDAPRRIAATTWSWTGVCNALTAAVVVDARPRTRGDGPDLRSRVRAGQLTIGIGPGYVAGGDVDVAIDSTFVEDACSTMSAHGEQPDAAAEGVVRAQIGGRFATASRIGDRVRRGEMLGMLDQLAIAAPRSGVLRGVSARGARVRPGDVIVEVDSTAERCFGLAPRALHIARAVREALPAPSAEPRRLEIEPAST